MNPVSPTFVIIGITGDLADKKLLPALYTLAERGLLGDDTRIVGTSRRPLENGAVIDKLGKPDGDTTAAWIDAHLTTLTADPGTPDGAETLAEFLKDDTRMRLFYLSIPPSTFGSVITAMAGAGLNGERDYLLVEKPFGRDLESATALHDLTDRYYNEANIFRVDHYLAKPGVRDMADSGREVLDPRRVNRIDVRSDEALDIEGRSDFYEQTGALRDVVQSHLLQVLAVCLSAYTAHANNASVHDVKADSLASLSVLKEYRAQYVGYRDETASPDTRTETYAALELTSDDHHWRDVRLSVRSGKALPAKVSDVTVGFSDGSERVFDMNANPGNILDGYEQILYDAARSDRTLFLSARDVDESWRIVDATLASWDAGDSGLEYYKKGTIPATDI